MDTSEPSAFRMPASSTAMYPLPTTTVFLQWGEGGGGGGGGRQCSGERGRGRGEEGDREGGEK